MEYLTRNAPASASAMPPIQMNSRAPRRSSSPATSTAVCGIVASRCWRAISLPFDAAAASAGGTGSTTGGHSAIVGDCGGTDVSEAATAGIGGAASTSAGHHTPPFDSVVGGTGADDRGGGGVAAGAGIGGAAS